MSAHTVSGLLRQIVLAGEKSVDLFDRVDYGGHR